jgi:hypothetical protein
MTVDEVVSRLNEVIKPDTRHYGWRAKMSYGEAMTGVIGYEWHEWDDEKKRAFVEGLHLLGIPDEIKSAPP